MWNRINKCIKEKCIYLPVCGGGCVYDAIVAHGKFGFEDRFCQKTLLADINKGLLKLNYAQSVHNFRPYIQTVYLFIRSVFFVIIFLYDQ